MPNLHRITQERNRAHHSMRHLQGATCWDAHKIQSRPWHRREEMSEYETTREQDEALRDWLQTSITPLIEQVLVKKIGQAMKFAAEELIQPKCDRIHCRCALKGEWVGLTDDEIDMIYQGAGKHDFAIAREIEAKLKEKNHE
jgi:hypothetical protein